MNSRSTTEFLRENTAIPRFMTADKQLYNLLKDISDILRQSMTPPEKLLWQELKANKLGFKFRRQHIIHLFIVDFVCLSRKLIIEVDGSIHKFQKARDRERTGVLNSLGYKVIRFTNDEVERDISLVVDKIREGLQD